MRTPILKSTKEEIKRKLLLLYSDSLDTGRDVLDFDKKYDFFSTDESVVLKFSSNWFRPEKYSSSVPSMNGKRQNFRLAQNEVNNPKFWPQTKQESLLKIEKALTTTTLPRDLEVLGKTPYHIGVDGEKFRVIAATLQKCNSPLVRRTFHFTSNGIVEASERKNETESAFSFVKQTKNVPATPKFVRIKRFRVIKKDDAVVDKYVFPQKLNLANGEKTRFLTVRIRPKVGNPVGAESPNVKLEAPPSEEKNVGTSEEKKGPRIVEPNLNLVVRMEEVEEEPSSDPETVIVEHEEDEEIKENDVKQSDQQVGQKEEKIEMFSCGNCGKQFPTYFSCLAHFRSHQRQVCQFCSKKFLTVKMLRDHIKTQHKHHSTAVETSEGRITTATSKFGRTRQVLNVAELRSKYKML